MQMEIESYVRVETRQSQAFKPRLEIWVSGRFTRTLGKEPANTPHWLLVEPLNLSSLEHCENPSVPKNHDILCLKIKAKL
jgi:hypothetical protein